MTSLVARARSAYGAHPLHLVLIAGGFALAASTVQVLGLAELWNPDVWWQSIVVWFVGAAVFHDLVLFPAYAGADRLLTTGARLVGRRRGRRSAAAVPVLNYVRVPLLACAFVTVLFAPGIVRQGADTYLYATGQTQDPFLLRWLLLCAGMLALGALAYGVASLRAARGGATTPTVEAAVSAPGPTATSTSAPPPSVASTTPPVPSPAPGVRDDDRRGLLLVIGAVVAGVLVIAVLRRRRVSRR